MGEANARYFGTLEFSGQQQAEALRAMGYPSVGEWQAARMLTDAELLGRAQKGDLRARQFLVDRVIVSIGPDTRAGLTNSAQDLEKAGLWTEAQAMALENLARTKSPFAAYQAAALFQASSQNLDPAFAAAGFQLARDLGDKRAAQLFDAYFRQHPDIDPRTMMAVYSMLKSAR